MTKRIRIKIGIVAVVTCVIGFSDWAFAEDNLDEFFAAFANLLNFIVSILLRIWVLFANLAGKFLTNGLVYGEAIGLDSLLWQYRVVVRNIANFGLGFYFVYVVFRAVISKDDITKNIKSILLKILIGGVGIQASWFLAAAVIDVSTITLVAAGSLPAQLVSHNSNVEASMKENLRKYVVMTDDNGENIGNSVQKITGGRVYNLLPKNGTHSSLLETYPITVSDNVSWENLFDSIVPNDKDVSGPLYYLGFSILGVEGGAGSVLPDIKASSTKGLMQTIFNTILKCGTAIVYSIEMFVLLIFSIMRVVYIWIFIVSSPIIILLWCINQSNGSGSKSDKGLFGGILEHINFKSFFINVFKPTIVVLGIGLTLIFVSLMSSVVNNADKQGSIDIGGVKMESNPDVTINGSNDKTYTTAFDSNVLNFTLAKASQTLLKLFLDIMTVILVYLVIRVTLIEVGKGNDFVSKGINKVQKNVVDDLVTSVPIMPVSGYDSQGVKTTHYVSAKSASKLLETTIQNTQNKIDKSISENSDIISNALGWTKSDMLTSTEMTNIKYATTLDKKRDIIKGLKTDEGKGMTLNSQTAKNDKFWINEFTGWMNAVDIREITNHKLYRMVNSWKRQNEDPEKRSLDELFSDVASGKDYIKDYLEYFLDKEDSRIKSITSWKDLKDVDISKNNSSK